MWIMIGLLIYTILYMPANLEMVLSVVGVNIATLLNYSYRRWIQYRRETTGKNFPMEDSDNNQYSYRQNNSSDINRGIDSPD